MPPCDGGFGAAGGTNVFVSILVLMDAALRQWTVFMRIVAYAVSILVLMDAALRQHDIGRYKVHVDVSILVLMDAALRPICFSGVDQLEQCFNPCFDGCRPATWLCLAAFAY